MIEKIKAFFNVREKRLKLYKILVTLFLILIFVMPGNVSNMPQIDQRVLVTALGIDLDPAGVKVIAQVLIPEGESNKSSQQIVTGKGKDFINGVENMSINMGRKIELAHCGMMVVGKELAKESVLPHFEQLVSVAKISAGIYVVSTKDLSAEDFLKKANTIDKSSSTGLNNFLTFCTIAAHIPTITLLEFTTNIFEESNSSYMPCIDVGAPLPKEDEGSSSSQSSGGESGGESKSSESSSQVEGINSIGIFDGGKLIEYLGEQETEGLTWLDRKSTKGLLQAHDIMVGDKNIGTSSATLKDKTFTQNVSIKNDIPKIVIRIDAELIKQDRRQYGSDADLAEKDIVKAIKEAFENKIKGDIQKAVDKVKSTGVDFMEFKTRFFKHKNKEYKAYVEKFGDTILQNMVVDYEINLKIR